MFLAAVFSILALWISSHQYNVMTMDIADATTNYIWLPHYAKGVFAIPYSQWTYGLTQSVVVLHNGQYYVLNEKAPGFSLLIVPFYLAHITWLFAPVIVAVAAISTYMLALRLAGWRAAFFATLIVLLNLSVLAMWSHYYWTDAATMHLLVLSVWLLVESNYQFNGKSLDPHAAVSSTALRKAGALVLSILSGLAFGAAVATRYPVALILPAFLLYIISFYLIRARHFMRERKHALRGMRGLVLLIFFIVGLTGVLIPLMQYNSAYFGGPFNSGYDATTLLSFSQAHQLAPRNQSQQWFASAYSNIGIAGRNFIELFPLLLFRMPALALLPFGLWYMRKDRAVLALLIPWIFIAFYTYLSISWVSQYDNSRIYIQTVWQPRYFMPAIPPTAILAGRALERFTTGIGNSVAAENGKGNGGRDANKRPESEQRVWPAVLFLTVVAALGIIPMILFFAHNSGVITAPGHSLPRTHRQLLELGEYLYHVTLSGFSAQ